jgi:hypothetical protein
MCHGWVSLGTAVTQCGAPGQGASRALIVLAKDGTRNLLIRRGCDASGGGTAVCSRRRFAVSRDSADVVLSLTRPVEVPNSRARGTQTERGVVRRAQMPLSLLLLQLLTSDILTGTAVTHHTKRRRATTDTGTTAGLRNLLSEEKRRWHKEMHGAVLLGSRPQEQSTTRGGAAEMSPRARQPSAGAAEAAAANDEGGKALRDLYTQSSMLARFMPEDAAGKK